MTFERWVKPSAQKAVDLVPNNRTSLSTSLRDDWKHHIVSFSDTHHHLIEHQPLSVGSLRWLYNLPQPGERSRWPSSEFRPATLINCDASAPGDDWLQTKLSTFLRDNDFTANFLENIIIAHHETVEKLNLHGDFFKNVVAGHDGREVFSIKKAADQEHIAEGPYFISSDHVHRTWRLVPDTHETFQLPTIHAREPKEFIGVTCTIGGHLMIPLPSKLHSPPTVKKPLNGLRITVKDIFDLSGVQTTAQSRAYARVYSLADQTAPVIARLVELGATIVGKTKCTQFASSEQPTADWVEYHCPWNPRGDGYLSPRGSSTGTCAAVAAYDWLDCGIGTDTGGSIRGPASAMGLFAIRSSFDAANMEGILPVAKSMDTIGSTCRDVKVFEQLVTMSFSISKDDATKVSQKPKRILYARDYFDEYPKDEAAAIRECFVQSLEKYTNVQRTEISLAQRWLEDDPAGNGLPLKEYLKDTFMNILWQGYYVNYEKFRTDHRKAFGFPPYVNPVIQYCWDRGSMVTDEDMKAANSSMATYRRWLRNNVLGADHFETIMIFPVGEVKPFYRDVYRLPPNQLPRYDWSEREDHQASLAGIPAIVLPVGQTAYPSKVTGQNQALPVSISVMSNFDTDQALVGLIKDLWASLDLPPQISAGPQAFPDGAEKPFCN